MVVFGAKSYFIMILVLLQFFREKGKLLRQNKTQVDEMILPLLAYGLEFLIGFLCR